MAVPNGHASERDVYRALIVDEYTDVSWQEYLQARSPADDGRSRLRRRAVADGGQLETGVELPDLHIGDHVTDRDDPDATMIVVGLPVEDASEYTVDDAPLTEYNPEHPADDDVVEVTYPQRTDVEMQEKKYAFPRSRLRLEAAIHSRDDEEAGA